MTVDISSTRDTEYGVAEILAKCKKSAEPALREAIGGLHPWPGGMATFTFGWAGSEAHVAGVRGGAGKGLRPAFALLCAEGVGASPEVAVPGAVAVELVHAFSLVHDDIMDGDEWRRHRETTWKAYGVGPAVLAGDALLALGVATLSQVPGDRGAAAIARLSRALLELVHGQSDDVAFEKRPWHGPEAVTVAEYLAMAAGKTGSLLGCAAAVGTLLGGGPAMLADAMARMGRQLGVAFQAVDDLLGIWGDPAVTGKPVLSDLRQGKKTLPVIAALEAGTQPARRLAELLDAGPLDEAGCYRARELISDAGGRAFATEQAALHLDEALKIIETAGLTAAAAADLMMLSRFLVNRSF